MNWFRYWLFSQMCFWILAGCFVYMARTNRELRRQLRRERAEHRDALLRWGNGEGR